MWAKTSTGASYLYAPIFILTLYKQRELELGCANTS